MAGAVMMGGYLGGEFRCSEKHRYGLGSIKGWRHDCARCGRGLRLYTNTEVWQGLLWRHNPPPFDHNEAPGKVLLYDPGRKQFLMSDVILYRGGSRAVPARDGGGMALHQQPKVTGKLMTRADRILPVFRGGSGTVPARDGGRVAKYQQLSVVRAVLAASFPGRPNFACHQGR